MPRRAAYALLVACFLALTAAVVPWTIGSDAVRRSVSAHLQEVAGLELSAAGPGTLAVLPLPRIAFDNVTLTAASGRPIVRGGSLKGELRILPLLAGRVEFAEASLSGSTIEVAFGGDNISLDEALAGLRERLAPDGATAHLRRFLLNGVNLRLRDRTTGFETALEDIHLAAEWPTPASPLEVTGSMAWRGQRVQIKTASIRPDALAAGRPSPLKIDVGAPLAGIAVAGELTLRDDKRFTGRAALTSRSLKAFAAWSGVALPLGNLIDGFGLDGEVQVDARGASWPAARVTLGNDQLDGALFWGADGERRSITSTLAANRLDLTALAASLGSLRPSPGGWSSAPFTLPSQSGIDLDLRLSAASARIGPLRVGDLAANLSVKAGRYEASVNRASIHKGVVKGRAVVTHAGDGVEVKAQSTFDRLDVAALLADLGVPRWASGSAQGQLAFEGAGESPAEIVRTLNGRATATVKGGELSGLALADLVRRGDGKPEFAWWGARTPFEQATLHVTVADGVAAITDTKLTGAGVRAGVQGRSSLLDRTMDAKANVEATSPGSAITMGFDVTGPWDALRVVPGARSITQPPEVTGSSAAVR